MDEINCSLKKRIKVPNEENDSYILCDLGSVSRTGISTIENSKSLYTCPQLQVFDRNRLFSLFHENSLTLKKFVESRTYDAMVKVSVIFEDEDMFRYFLFHGLLHTSLRDLSANMDFLVNLYTFYLMSMHTNKELATACLEYLRLKKFSPRLREIFTVFVNLGADSDIVFDCKNAVRLKSIGSEPKTEGVGFPFYNMELVSRFLTSYVQGDSFTTNENDLRLFIKALSRILRDPLIRTNSIYATISTLLNKLIAKAASLYDVSVVASWLNLEGEELLTRMNLCLGLTLHGFNPSVFEAVSFMLIKSILNLKDSSSLKYPLKSRDWQNLLSNLKNTKLKPLKFYCLLQLLKYTLDYTTSTSQDRKTLKETIYLLEDCFTKPKQQDDRSRFKNLCLNLMNLFIKDEETASYKKKKMVDKRNVLPSTQ